MDADGNRRPGLLLRFQQKPGRERYSQACLLLLRFTFLRFADVAFFTNGWQDPPPALRCPDSLYCDSHFPAVVGSHTRGSSEVCLWGPSPGGACSPTPRGRPNSAQCQTLCIRRARAIYTGLHKVSFTNQAQQRFNNKS